MTPEQKVKNDVLPWLCSQPDIFAWVNQSVGIYDPFKKCYRKNNSKFHTKGISDLTVIVKKLSSAVVCFIELKSKRGVQSDEQKEFERNVVSKNGVYFVARSLIDVMREINKIRAL